MSFFQIMSQNDSMQKTNPIIYFEASAGVARLNSDISTNVNFTGIYQKNKDLLTFRFSESSVINGRLISVFFGLNLGASNWNFTSEGGVLTLLY